LWIVLQTAIMEITGATEVAWSIALTTTNLTKLKPSLHILTERLSQLVNIINLLVWSTHLGTNM
jgi:hypothetical protein